MIIRPARPEDLPALVDLCVAHAAFERAAIDPTGLADRLAAALFGTGRLGCLVLDADGRLDGYATFGREFSTWAGAEYTHLDCLFVTGARRGGGWGRRLFEEVVARADGEVQWQTPEWNTDARRFYERLGARPAPKIRYTLPA
ncbi:GNAT family N-acetyltransferase [Longispora sp. K20-0274]|uniref:GNAT family N-acetyltransferase n=1 Tax=Longispora sp. K20-0274 TaxID=3088255 RepID=UPI00399C246F